MRLDTQRKPGRYHALNLAREYRRGYNKLPHCAWGDREEDDDGGGPGPGPGGAPTLISVDPNTMAVDDKPVLFTVLGADLVPNVTYAYVDDTACVSTCFSSEDMTFYYPDDDYSQVAGPHQLTLRVFSTGTPSNALPLTVTTSGPVPTITSVTPSPADTEAGTFVMTITGTGFTDGATVSVGYLGSEYAGEIDYTSDTQIVLPNADVADFWGAGTVPIRVVTPGGASNIFDLPVAP